MMGRPSLLILLMLLTTLSVAQSEVCLSIANEQADATAGTYEFDVYINLKDASQSDIYLATADFRLEFNSANFSNSTFDQLSHPNPPLGIQAGYCEFVSTMPDGGVNDALLRNGYYNLISTSVSGDLASINLNTPTASASTITSSIAVIEETPNKHRLGRFRLTGYTGGNADLRWRLAGALRSRVFSFDTNAPYTANEVQPSPCTTISIDQGLNHHNFAQCYPSPAHGQCWFRIETQMPQAATVKLYDLYGKLVASHRWIARPGFDEPLSLYNLTEGTYTYSLKLGSKVTAGKVIVVQH